MPSFTSYQLLEACREPGCPICRLEQEGVERYMNSQFYENVNSPAWREHLRASQAFCHEHAWLGVHKRLGDALGFSIIYHDVVNNLLKSWNDDAGSMRTQMEGFLAALAPRKPCPACKQREEITRNTLAGLMKDLLAPELRQALQASEGLCLPHLRRALGAAKDDSTYDILFTIHREKLEKLRNELAEFIRRNDYRMIGEGFGAEGDAWLRAIGTIVGSRKDR